jgi:hypothetical protein
LNGEGTTPEFRGGSRKQTMNKKKKPWFPLLSPTVPIKKASINVNTDDASAENHDTRSHAD